MLCLTLVPTQKPDQELYATSSKYVLLMSHFSLSSKLGFSGFCIVIYSYVTKTEHTINFLVI